MARGCIRALATARRAPTFHFDEDEHRPAPRNQIDLDTIRADVASDDAIPSLFEESGGLRFAFMSKCLSKIRHHSFAAEGACLIYVFFSSVQWVVWMLST